jgi:periplasmic protein TonB
MPREMFASPPPLIPKRSRWTIAGSILLHVGLVGALLILPVLSAFDTFVVRANNVLQFALPAVAMPAMPPAPSTAPQIAPDIKENAAPTSPAEKPVTTEVTQPPPPGMQFVPGGPGSGSNLPPGVGIGSGTDVVSAPPPPATPPPGPVRPGGEIKFPARTFFVSPAYPALAKSARIEGTVYLEATIDANGIVRDVRVLKSIPLLDEAAKAAVSQWRYSPTKLNGVAVPVILTVTVTFSLK